MRQYTHQLSLTQNPLHLHPAAHPHLNFILNNTTSQASINCIKNTLLSEPSDRLFEPTLAWLEHLRQVYQIEEQGAKKSAKNLKKRYASK